MVSKEERKEFLKKLDEFRGYLKIDRDALDEAIIMQSDLYYRVSRMFVLAVSKKDKLKEEIAIVDANLDMDLREEAANKKKGEKVTEGAIRGQIAAHRAHIESIREYLDARREMEELQALKDAFSQRGYMLRELARLYIAGYYQSPVISGGPRSREEGETVVRGLRAKMGKRKKKKKKSGRERI